MMPTKRAAVQRNLALTLLAAGILTVAIPEQAEARRGLPLVIINHGEEIAAVADLPAELAENPELEGWKLGWKYSHFGILWADFYTWDKDLVMFKDNTFADLPEELKTSLAQQHPFSGADRNPWTRFGWLAFVGMGAMGIVSKTRGG